MKHVLINDPSLNGWEYGMLRSFEAAIVKETGAGIFDLPPYVFAGKYQRHFQHGMNRGVYRKYFPKQELAIKADTAWCILMGPENYRLDLYKGWENNCKTKILYLYDTLPSQYPLIKRLFSNNNWDILITSFNDAVDDLKKMTGRDWYCVEQAADEALFQPVPFQERIIHFSSYGRRYPLLHETLKEFCRDKNLYYDYTTHDAKHPVAEAPELYKQYAWHLSHSLFTLSWPVELTNPSRAGHLRPITCRWFEAAAAGTIILGKAPDNPSFEKLFYGKNVVEGDLLADKKSTLLALEKIWNERETLFNRSFEKRRQYAQNWTWNERVQRILSLI